MYSLRVASILPCQLSDAWLASILWQSQTYGYYILHETEGVDCWQIRRLTSHVQTKFLCHYKQDGNDEL